MKELSTTFTSRGRVVAPVDLRRKHKIRAGTRVRFLEDEFGRIVLVPIAEAYIDRVRGCLAGGPDLLAMWEKERRAEGKREDKRLRLRNRG